MKRLICKFLGHKWAVLSTEEELSYTLVICTTRVACKACNKVKEEISWKSLNSGKQEKHG